MVQIVGFMVNALTFSLNGTGGNREAVARLGALCSAAAMALFAASALAQQIPAPTFPEAASFLAEKGYFPDEYTVLLSWQERSSGENGLVTGYHILPADGSAVFDLYSDGQGNLLDPIALAARGVHPKNWNLPPIEQGPEIPAPVVANVQERPVPMGNVTKALAGPSIQLPPLDLVALQIEDDQRDQAPDKGARRIGVVRDVGGSIVLDGSAAPSEGKWEARPDGGSLWLLTLASPDARAIRVHFSELAVPAGVRLILYNTRNPVEAYGPYAHPFGHDADLWSDSCFSDTVTLECYAAPGADLSLLRVVVDSVVHTYADFSDLQWAKSAGSCERDVSCYSDWEVPAKGVGGFNFVSGSTQLHCTGSLVVDTVPSSTIPYFLTANHCVSTQEGSMGASNMEFFWLYQTPSCGGTAPSLSSVPRTLGGADYLAGISSATGSDFALVRLRVNPPDGVAYLGWTTEVPSLGSNVAVIHHPQGDFKRISFGHTTNTGSPQNSYEPVKPYAYFHEIHWDIGTTEPASSGSPLFDVDTQLIVGQLWGGYAACSKPEEPDYFGRFDKTFPVIQSWLAPVQPLADVDKSGSVDSADLQIVVNAVLGIPVAYDADVNGSGAVDAIDVQLVILAILRGGT